MRKRGGDIVPRNNLCSRDLITKRDVDVSALVRAWMSREDIVSCPMLNARFHKRHCLRISRALERDYNTAGAGLRDKLRTRIQVCQRCALDRIVDGGSM